MATTTQPRKQKRYHTLDALRGIAALIVIWYHVFEGFATSPVDQYFNHGYLAVDFFFLLSGFVIGHSYDPRLNSGAMSTSQFLLHRLVRLHPMVLMGVLIGAIAFIAAGSQRWDGTEVPLIMLLAASLFNIFLMPVLPGTGTDVRGNGEMFPLNGPHWSLFFEYVTNIIYALIVRHLSTRALSMLTAAMAIVLCTTAIGNASGYHHLGMGWTLADLNLWGGLARVMFSFSAGLLMARTIKPRECTHAFLKSSLILIAVMIVPHIGGESTIGWINGLYDSLIVIVIFPIALYIGASARETGKHNWKQTLGQLSYPLYAIHYPLMYIFYAWLWAGNISLAHSWHIAIAIVFTSIILAWMLHQYYDKPLREWLTAKIQKKIAAQYCRK